MRVLVACEFSGIVREAFAKRGHSAWSCDLRPTLIPGNHLRMDVFEALRDDWDLLIAHPPCTFLSNMSNCRINEPGRLEKRKEAMEFFMRLVNAKVPRKAIENPRGFPEREYRTPDQIIQPWMFGHPQSKATCLWLHGLPLLIPTNVVEPSRKWDGKRWRTFVDRLPSSSPKRSITFQGIADAMAEQWSAREGR